MSQEVYNLVSHATQERLRNILEKLSTISLHRLEVYRVCSITTTTAINNNNNNIRNLYGVTFQKNLLINCTPHHKK